MKPKFAGTAASGATAVNVGVGNSDTEPAFHAGSSLIVKKSVPTDSPWLELAVVVWANVAKRVTARAMGANVLTADPPDVEHGTGTRAKESTGATGPPLPDSGMKIDPVLLTNNPIVSGKDKRRGGMHDGAHPRPLFTT